MSCQGLKLNIKAVLSVIFFITDALVVLWIGCYAFESLGAGHWGRLPCGLTVATLVIMFIVFAICRGIWIDAHKKWFIKADDDG
jgi:hypothetical protein